MKKKSRERLTRPALCSLALGVCLSFSGCGFVGNQMGDKMNAADTIVYVIGQSKGDQFWDSVQQGAKEASEEFGYQVFYRSAEQITDIDSQRKLIREAINANASSIVIAPNDPDALNDDLAAAIQAGVKVITIDSQSSFGGYDSYIGTINASSGAIAARNAFTFFKDMYNDKALIVTESAETPSSVDRLSGFTPCLTGMVKSQAGAEFAAQMQAVAQEQLDQVAQMAAEPEVKAKVSEAASSAAAAAAAQNAPPDAIANAAAQAAAAAAIDLGAAPGVAATAAGQASGLNGGDTTASLMAAQIVQEHYNQESDTQSGSSAIDEINPIASVLNCKGNTDVAKEQVLQLLSNDADNHIKVIFTTGERSTIGACEAVAEADLVGKVAIIGYNTSDTELTYLRNGTLTGTIVQNPYNMGYLGVYYSGKLIAGEDIAKMVDTGAAYVTLENLNSDEIRLLLDPAEFTKK